MVNGHNVCWYDHEEAVRPMEHNTIINIQVKKGAENWFWSHSDLRLEQYYVYVHVGLLSTKSVISYKHSNRKCKLRSVCN